MTDVTRSVWSNVVGGIPLHFEDISTSNTVPFVFGELAYDYYGLEQITLSEDDVVLDVGANVGMFSIYVRKKFKCKVIAFEPVPMNLEHFRRNIALNGLSEDEIEIHDVAITHVDGELVRIGTPLDNTGGSSIFDSNVNFSMCKSETLPKYITDKCRYLKMDCEGSEYMIIPTILDRLNQFDYIGIEYHKFNEYQDPTVLHNLIIENFKGRIFCKEW